MTRDPPPPTADDADAELSSLFATLKDDQAPPDIEARLLAGLATAAVAGAGAAAVKSGVWHEIALWLGTGGLSKSILLGALCGGVVCGAITLADGLESAAPPAGLPTSVTGPLARPADTSTPGSPPANAVEPAREGGAQSEYDKCYELLAALVDSGRCAEARTAIAAYRAEHRTGQLAAEVDVLLTRCQGR